MQPRLFFGECIQVKPSCKSIIMMKEALSRLTVFSFSPQTHFQWECYMHFYTSIKIAIFKTVRRLDITWNFACSITRVSAHEQEHWEHCLCTQSLLKKKVFEQLTLAVACFASRRHGSRDLMYSVIDTSGLGKKNMTDWDLQNDSYSYRWHNNQQIQGSCWDQIIAQMCLELGTTKVNNLC